jgi:DNA-binding protein YbaB
MLIDSRRCAQMVLGARKLTEVATAITSVVERELSGSHSVGMSDGRMVKAIADHRARVTRIEIAPAGLTRTRGPQLAQQVVQAVSRAQAQARAAYEHVLRTGHWPEG